MVRNDFEPIFPFFFLDGKNRQNVGFAQFKKKNWVYTINFTKDLHTAFGRMNFADFVSCVQMKRVEGYFHSYGIKEDQLD